MIILIIAHAVNHLSSCTRVKMIIMMMFIIWMIIIVITGLSDDYSDNCSRCEPLILLYPCEDLDHHNRDKINMMIKSSEPV